MTVILDYVVNGSCGGFNSLHHNLKVMERSYSKKKIMENANRQTSMLNLFSAARPSSILKEYQNP
ncbi:hypothetical protein HCX49_01945 [Sphingobacterium kitahiroshimense]|uniref:hypothetical protein n=1 Tax=Sphingobacterium sp. B16(2022) TaxID=2914044 RepID=UPI00143A0B37|nr:hypothetical protein [Sphingobacterium sp. B16(2022)]NJI71958.1 hypothetical protein [Sphingobacterium sp. B16(2022)]